MSPLVSVTDLPFFSSSDLQLLQVAVRFRTESEVLISHWTPWKHHRQPGAMQIFETNVVFEKHAKQALVAQTVKKTSVMQEIWVHSLGWEDPQEKRIATHSSILAWRIPWTEEPGGLQSTGLQRVGHD